MLLLAFVKPGCVDVQHSATLSTTSSMRLVIKNDATTERSNGKQTKNITHLHHKHGDLLKPAGREYFSQNEDGEIARLQRGEPDMTRVTSDN